MDAKSKALKVHRARLKNRGMKRLEVCVPVGEAAVIRRAATVLREQTAEATRLRQLLGFSPQPGGGASAVDLFAMPEPSSPVDDALWDEAMAQIARDRKDSAINRLRKFDS